LKTNKEIIKSVVSTIQIEGNAILNLEKFIDDTFADVVNSILLGKGRLIVTGIGKSANISQKLVSTFNSTGQPAVFMHAADAIHGDLGNVQKGDIVLCISKSGNTPEIKSLIPLIKNMGNDIIAISGNKESFLAKNATWNIDASVEKEACPNNLAPTTSTTAQLVMGDALAVCLLKARNFSDSDFARFHPGGSLGKKLFLKVGDLSGPNQVPKVLSNSSINEVILEISHKRLGATAVVEKDTVVGMITDGDIRRMLEAQLDMQKMTAKDIMNATPKTIQKKELAVEALKVIQENNISQILVLDGETYHGIVHLHDILKEGIL
jgi:arabinose-5-phosphate isomerase